MNKKKHVIIRLIRTGALLLTAILTVAAFTQDFYPFNLFDLQFLSLIQRTCITAAAGALILLFTVLTATLLFGRIYCSVLCPLGIFQELIMLIFRKKMRPRQNNSYKYIWGALLWGTLIGGSTVLIRLTDPYALTGSALSGGIIGLCALTLIGVLVLLRGRLFCTDICPVGLLLGLLSRRAPFKICLDEKNCVACGLCMRICPTGSIDIKRKTVNAETCVKCLKCLGTCPKGALCYRQKNTPPPPFDPDRRHFLKTGAAALIFLAAVKGGIDLSRRTGQKIKNIILPPGAKNPSDFVNRCLNCNLCVQNCPMKILKKADRHFPAVRIDYKENFCDYTCHKCTQVCPCGAISRISLAEKQQTQIARARINEAVCVACGLCVKECPRHAINQNNSKPPRVNQTNCIGCGACKCICPVQAIMISPVNRQKTLRNIPLK